MITLTNVSKVYANGFRALDDINLTIKQGEIFGIIGESGAGKSTLLRSINLLEEPSSGKVSVDGEELTALNPHQLRLARFKQAMIFQHFNLLANKTVYDNIAVAMQIQGKKTDVIANKITQLLDLVDLSDKRNAYPSELSGGQKQRVAIARALSCDPKLLLCDEATSALDPNTTGAILDLLKNINAQLGITIVLITHQMDVIKQLCHRVALISAGQIIENVAVKEITQLPEKSLTKQLFIKQFTPKLPDYLRNTLTHAPQENTFPIARCLFHHNTAARPLISRLSRELTMDINILQANIDAIDNTTFGVLIVELRGSKEAITQFYQRAEQQKLSVEVIGYVPANVL